MTDRFVPTRAGVVNLWDYRDEEFVFADGWLVLRGPNGSGKTKALEVLFPFVLDGRTAPRRLNPFASEERTMKSNLLYRGQEAGYAYAWLEFRRGQGVEGRGGATAGGEAQQEAVTVGVGMQAHRHRDAVRRWYFVVDGRVGVDFSLLGDDDRPLTRKQLIDEVGADAVRDRSSEHRSAVDARLFGLGPDRYEQLLNLVLTLRRPQLAKDLDPAKLSDTLADGLRPLDDTLVAEAARSFDDLEAVQRTLDGLVAADRATGAFLGVYATYLRTHARAAADAVTDRRRATADGREGLAAARRTHQDAVAAQQQAAQTLAGAEQRLATARAYLESLKASAAYQNREQLLKLRDVVGQLATAAEQAERQATARRQEADQRERELAQAEGALRDQRGEESRRAAGLAGDAADAGIAWTAADAAAEGFADRVTAGATARKEDVAAVRAAVAAHQVAMREQERAAGARDIAGARRDAAAEAERATAGAVTEARAELADRLADWRVTHESTLDALVGDGPGLAGRVAETLAASVEVAGEPEAVPPRAAFDRLVAAAVQDRRDHAASLRSRHATLAGEHDQVVAERELIAAERDDAPPGFTARTATDRDTRSGAPLWRLVRFAGELAEAEAAAVEAALEAANLLDAWVSPSGGPPPDGTSDGFLAPLPPRQRPAGPTLADVLVPEEQDTTVPAGRVADLLASVALLPPSEAPDTAGVSPAVSRTGRFVQGIQLGGHHKPVPEYVGATARARRRAARIADCDTRIAALGAARDRVAAEIAAVDDLLAAVAAAAERLPGVGPVATARRAHQDAAVTLRLRGEALDDAQAQLDQAVAHAAAAERAVRKAAAARAVGPAALDEVSGAVSRFERTAGELVGVRRLVAMCLADRDGAAARHDAAQAAREAAAVASAQARTRHATEATELATLDGAVGADAATVAREVDAARAGIGQADAAHQAATGAERSAVAARVRAEAQETAAADRLALAVTEEQRTAGALNPYAQPDLLRLLRCPEELHWPALAEDWPDPAAVLAQGVDALPEPVVALHRAVLAATRELTPTESSLKQSVTRLTKGLEELQDQLAAAGQDYRPEWDPTGGVWVVRVADEQGYRPIGEFAARIAAERREQEEYLTAAERRIFEDTLLTQLARQIHDRTVDARDLVARMNAEMRARTMSSGVSVGVGLQQADHLDDEQRAVYALLDRDPAVLGPDELARIRAHFASRIQAARANRPDRTYRELLGDVLDYRRWRKFAFSLHRPGAGTDSEPLTRRKHAQLSGGEQSVSLHLPLFAAAHALFESARAGSPRLLALDEAFAGVDELGRGELMRLAVQFDLDLFMTGYDLWATHAAVPGCAHYDLSHAPTEHLVASVLLVWDGSENLADADGSLSSLLGSPGTRRCPGRTPEPAALDFAPAT